MILAEINVIVVMAEIPGLETCGLCDRIEHRGEVIELADAHEGHAESGDGFFRCAVCEDVIDLIAVLCKILECLVIFFDGGKLTGPPRNVSLTI